MAQLDLGSLGAGLGAPDAADVVTVRAQFAKPEAGTPARLFVAATMAPGWHIYSLTQPKGGPIRTTIQVEESPAFKLVGPFQPSPPPEKHPEPAFDNLTVETHERTVTWFADLELAEGVDPVSLEIKGSVRAQACAEVCNPPTDYSFVARLGEGLPVETKPPVAGGSPATAEPAPIAASPDAETPYADPGSHLTLAGTMEAEELVAGGTFRLTLRAEPQPGYHVYALASDDDQRGPKPTLVRLELPTGWQAGPFSTDVAPTEKASTAWQGVVERYHDRAVSWTAEVRVAADAPAQEHTISGVVGFQTCDEGSSCDLPRGARFSATLRVGGASSQVAALRFEEAKYRDAKPKASTANTTALAPAAPSAGFRSDSLSAASTGVELSIPRVMAYGFLGGLILNLMPCVLPVIGLKILSFVSQSGQSRSRVLSLNLAYTAGLMLVFMILANLAVTAKLGWGQHASSPGFSITLAAIVFAMGLSFLGLWEIPLPGFVGSGKVGDLASQEGLTGAFFKGALTTVLATPCSGPFLATAVAWAIAQPPALTYAVFASIGLGMASPYLLLGAFPSLVRFLPKPGAWMDTFKQIMGFFLIGTVVFLFTAMNPALVVPTFALLVGIWIACWRLGRTPLTAELPAKLAAWTQAAALIALAAFVSFGAIGGADGRPPRFEGLSRIMQYRFERRVQERIAQQLPEDSAELALDAPYTVRWRPYTERALARLAEANQTVLIDFTADWCATCKTLEALYLHTTPVEDALRRNRVATLVADWTDTPEDITRMLESLGSKQVPVLAIFPAGRWKEPIVLRGGYTAQSLIAAIEQAGPSQPAPTQTARAN